MGFYTVYKKQKEYRYMKKTIKRKQKLGIRIGVGCALVITVILLAVQGVSNLTKKPVDTSEGIAYIKGKESADAKTIEQKINQLEKKDGTGDSSDTRSMKERFSGAVVMGDSIAASFTEYDVLNTSSVVAKIGIHFSELDDQIEQAKQLDPQIVFLAYGMNDVTKTNGDVDKFIKDYSGSMDWLYDNGSVQETISRLLPIALRFDDNGELESWLFSNGAERLKAANADNYSSYVKNVMKKAHMYMGGTNYAPVLKEMVTYYKDIEPSEIPAFIIFITDGENSDTFATNAVIKELSEYNIFVQFIGIGDEDFDYLKSLDDMKGRKHDNTGFTAVKDMNKMSDEQLYTEILRQYKDWLNNK